MMYYGYGSGWMWAVGTLMMLLFWGGLGVLIVWAVKAFVGPRRADDTAEQILKRRLAAGQISQEDYDRTRRTLGQG